MPDLRLNAVTADIKPRPLMDQSASDLGSSQFLDTMLSSTFATGDDTMVERKADPVQRTTNDMGVTAKSATRAPERADRPEKPEAAAKTENTNATGDIKARIKAKLKEMAAKDASPVKDTKALKTLQKVAKFLEQASDDGQISLPPEMVQKLDEFLAKGDDLKAFDIANFMTEFADAFRGMTIQMAAPAAPAPDAAPVADAARPFSWPDDISDSYKELGLAGAASAVQGKPLDTLGALRAVKALVNESRNAAIKTLDENSQIGLSAQDPASILLTGLQMPLPDKTIETAPANTPVPASPVPTTPVAGAEQISAASSLIAPTVETAKKDMQAALLALNEMPKMPTVPLATPFLQQAQKIVAAPQISLTKLAIQQAFPVQQEKKSVVETDGQTATSDAAPSDTGPVKTTTQPTISADASIRPDPQMILPQQPLPVHEASREQNVPITGLTGVDPTAIAGNLTGAKAVMQNDAVQSLAKAIDGNTPMQQVVVHIQQRANKSGAMTINMTPAELGQVEVRLETSIDGKTRAVVMAEKPETLALLQKDATQLERALQQAGLNADAKNMSFNLRDQNNNPQQFGQQGRKRFAREAITETSGTEIAINVSSAGQIFSDTQINYHA